MPANIFINYRRDDSLWNTQALYNSLQKYFPNNTIFKDFNTIRPGEDFVESINTALDQCQVLLVVISKNWLTVTNANGENRLHDADDFVRIEIATALKRNIRVIPLLFDGVKMPLKEALPEDIQPLIQRQFIPIDNQKFDSDVQKLSEAIKEILGGKKVPPIKRSFTISMSMLLRFLLSGVVGLILAKLIYKAMVSLAKFLFGRELDSGSFSTGPLNYGIEGPLTAAVLWGLVGAIAGTNKKLWLSSIITSFIILIIWIICIRLFNNEAADSIEWAIAFVMPLSGILTLLLMLAVKKFRTSSSLSKLKKNKRV